MQKLYVALTPSGRMGGTRSPAELRAAPFTLIRGRNTMTSRQWLGGIEELGIGFVPFSPRGLDFCWQHRREYELRSDRLPEHGAAFFAGGSQGQYGSGRSGQERRRTQGSDASASCTGEAARAEAVDRAIPGTTTLHRLEENLGAVNVELSARPTSRRSGNFFEPEARRSLSAGSCIEDDRTLRVHLA